MWACSLNGVSKFCWAVPHHRLHGLFTFDIKIWALFHAPSELPITYRVSPPWAQSKACRAHPPRHNERSHTQIALTLPESCPSQTCFPAPCCANLLRTHRVISGAPGCLSHFFFSFSFPFFFFSKYLRDSLISQRLNFHPRILDFISNPANPTLSCLLIGCALWTWEWLPSGWRCLFRLQRSIELWWN